MGALKTALTACGGALMGVAMMTVVQRHLAPPPSAPSLAPPALPLHASERLSARDRVTEARLSDLEARLAGKAAVAPVAPVAADATAVAQPTLDDARLAFEQRLSEHAAAPRNGSWAAATERTVTDSINKIAADHGQSFALVGVDCRTSTCVARMRWPNADAARADVRTVVESGEVPCARELTLPASSGGSAYEASLLFDCATAAAAPARN